MKIKLIALVPLAAGSVPGIDVELPPNAEFELDADAAEPLLTAGTVRLASAPPSPAPRERLLKVRVLADCAHGRPNDLVELPAGVAKQAEKDGLVDSDKAAVAYAAELPQNKKEQG